VGRVAPDRLAGPSPGVPGAVLGLDLGADERPCKIVENPVSVEDLHATLYRSMGIPADLAYTVEGRPFHVSKDGKGKPVMELFA